MFRFVTYFLIILFTVIMLKPSRRLSQWNLLNQRRYLQESLNTGSDKFESDEDFQMEVGAIETLVDSPPSESPGSSHEN